MGVSPDVSNEDGLTALHQCCIDDNESMLSLLIEFSANVNARDSEAWTPLHAAATCGHVHLCKILIDSGGELLAVNADGNMPYDICEDDTTLDFVESEMAKRGVTQEEIDSTRDATEQEFLADLKEIASHKGSLEFKDPINGATPLHIAAANGYMEVGEFLLDKHVPVDARDDDSWQPIHAAACWCQPEMLELLVKFGANIDAKTRNGETPFDICEEPDLKQKILDLKDAIETKEATRRKEIENRRRSHSRRSSLYSSNSSLSDAHLLSASIRRSSMREKNLLSLKDAKDEAARLAVGITDEDEETDNSSGTESRVPATNIDDISTDINQNQNLTKGDRMKRNSKDAGPITRKGTTRHVIMEVDERKNTDTDDNDVNDDNRASSRESNRESNRDSDALTDRDDSSMSQSVISQRERRAVMGRMKDVLPPIASAPQTMDSGSKTTSSDITNVRDVSQNVATNEKLVNEKQRMSVQNIGVQVLPSEKRVPPNGKRGSVPNVVSSTQNERRSSMPINTTNTQNNERGVDTGSNENITPHSPNTTTPNEQNKPTPQPRVVPPVTNKQQGTLSELKKQRSEKYNSLRLKDNVDEKLENMYNNSYCNDDPGAPTSNSHKPVPLAPSAPKASSKNGHNTPGGRSPMAKYTAPGTVSVIEGSPRKKECCVIL